MCIASMGNKRFIGFFSPLQVKSKIRRGLRPTWVITAMGENYRLWRSITASKGNTATFPAWACLSNSVCMNSASLRVDV